MSIRGPAIWNNFAANTEKEPESSSLFKSKIKTKLIDFENKVTFFQNKRKGYFCFVIFIMSKIRYITSELAASLNSY